MKNGSQPPQGNQGQQSYTRGKVNHATAETAQDNLTVVLGMFLVNSVLLQFYLILEHRILLLPPSLWLSIIFLSAS